SGAGLGDAERADRLAPRDARQVLALLGVGAEAHEPGRRHVGVDEDAEGHAARAAARHLLAEHDAGEEVGPTPTVLRRELEAEETELAEALPQLAWDASRRLPLADARRDLLLDEGVDRDRKSRRLNSSHGSISYAVFC